MRPGLHSQHLLSPPPPRAALQQSAAAGRQATNTALLQAGAGCVPEWRALQGRLRLRQARGLGHAALRQWRRVRGGVAPRLHARCAAASSLSWLTSAASPGQPAALRHTAMECAAGAMLTPVPAAHSCAPQLPILVLSAELTVRLLLQARAGTAWPMAPGTRASGWTVSAARAPGTRPVTRPSTAASGGACSPMGRAPIWSPACCATQVDLTCLAKVLADDSHTAADSAGCAQGRGCLASSRGRARAPTQTAPATTAPGTKGSGE